MTRVFEARCLHRVIVSTAGEERSCVTLRLRTPRYRIDTTPLVTRETLQELSRLAVPDIDLGICGRVNSVSFTQGK